MARRSSDEDEPRHGSSRLYKLLAYHEELAQALRITIGLLNGHAKRSSAQREGVTLAAAVDLDRARVATTRTSTKKPKATRSHPPRLTHTEAKLARRKRTAKFLALFNDTTPFNPDGINLNDVGISVLLQHGYLKKTRDGFLRTAKPFEVSA